MNLHEFAENEFSRLQESEEQQIMNDNILQIVDLFEKQGHTGYTARYVIQVLERLLRYKPLSSLSGEYNEWFETEDNVLQNKRCPSVYKDSDGNVYDTDAIIVSDDGGLSWYESTDELYEDIEFPYWPPTVPEQMYLEFVGDAEDNKKEYKVITEDEEAISELRKKKLEEQANQENKEEAKQDE